MLSRKWLLGVGGLTILLATVAVAEIPKPETFDEKGFTSIFDGKTLDGWKVSAKTGHSGTSKNKSGGKWVIEDGAIVGSQDVPANGGIIITEKEYGDFEIALEMRNDDGPDSGLFLRLEVFDLSLDHGDFVCPRRSIVEPRERRVFHPRALDRAGQADRLAEHPRRLVVATR